MWVNLILLYDSLCSYMVDIVSIYRDFMNNNDELLIYRYFVRLWHIGDFYRYFTKSVKSL